MCPPTYMHPCTDSIENEVDGEAFLLLTEEQLKFLVKAIGPQMKLINRREKLNGFTPSFSTARAAGADPGVILRG